ncbi:glycolipid 2-alpha-mannosyltransferase-domain-containing protein [Favolaschia claudopus]|uniref:Glycolipid 2-alpha-mannosyltransferase-domain-containing protein n=1 Tax=Favolaschia claudopus TaxID=2862362 RepID=A0AAW0DGI0_9AGAR
MCRFNSGFFFRHELLAKYRWYWRIEPDVMFYCTLSFDPFVYMEKQNKTYTFTIALYEWAATIPTLWDTVNGVSSLVLLSCGFCAPDFALLASSSTFHHERSANPVLFMKQTPDTVAPANAMGFLSLPAIEYEDKRGHRLRLQRHRRHRHLRCWIEI